MSKDYYKTLGVEKNANAEEINYSPTKPMSSQKVVVVAVISAIVGAGSVLAVWYVFSIKKDAASISEHVPSEIVSTQESPSESEKSIAESGEVGYQGDGSILFIREGDVWQSDLSGKEQVKLIDRDNVVKAESSSDGQYIAYTYKESVEAEYTNFEGETEVHEVSQTHLVLADGRGGHSYEVAPTVDRWGWVPNSDFLWFEEAEVSQFYYVDYYGNNGLKIFDVKSKSITTLLEPIESRLDFQWSPDGKKVIYVTPHREVIDPSCCELNLWITDRVTGESSKLMFVPYAGGDRGGPPPIPSFYWSGDSRFVYTAFTPFYFDQQEIDSGLADEFTKGFLHIYKIPIDGSAPEKIFDDARAKIVNNEIYPKVTFSSDFSTVVYLENTDYSEEDEYFDVYKRTGTSLVAYDFLAHKKTVLVETIPEAFGVGAADLSNTTWVNNEHVVLFRLEQDYTISADVYDLNNGRTLASYDVPGDRIYSVEYVKSQTGERAGVVLIDTSIYLVTENGVTEILTGVSDMSVK